MSRLYLFDPVPMFYFNLNKPFIFKIFDNSLIIIALFQQFYNFNDTNVMSKSQKLIIKSNITL